MSIISKKGDLYAMAALSCVVFLYASYCRSPKLKSPSNKMYFPKKLIVNAGVQQTMDNRSTIYQQTLWSLLDPNVTTSLPLPRIDSYQCRDQICSEFLSAKDERNIRSCINSSKPLNIVPKCHFMNGTRRGPVALVSFPGSGNTWVRGLLEKVTGICTGSKYCDKRIRNSGAIGEHVQSGSVLVVKTHGVVFRFSDYKKNTVGQHPKGYAAGIVLLRNPLQAMVSEWNRRAAGGVKERLGGNPHVASLPQKYFGNYTKWQEYITTALPHWKKLISNVLLSRNEYPVLLVCYDDIQKDSTTEVKRILDFLHVPYSNSTLQKRLAEGYSTFHRKHTSTFEPFTESQKQLVRTGVNDLLSQLQQRKRIIPGLKEYLTSIVLNIT